MIPERHENVTRVLSFTDHLQELRVRIIICLIFFMCTLCGGFLIAPRVVRFLINPLVSLPQRQPQQPLLTLKLETDGTVKWILRNGAVPGSEALPITTATLAAVLPDSIRVERPLGLPAYDVGHKSRSSLFYLSPLEPFILWLQAALLVSAVLTLPMLLYQLWLFISPGLVRKERKVIVPILMGGVLLFPMGAYVAYLLLHITLKVLLGFGNAIPGLEPNLVASRYLTFALVMMLAFGLAFEFPLLLVLLSRLGVVSASLLVKRRRVAIVIMAVVAAIATPSPDPFSMLALFFPLLVLYEGAIWAIKMMDASREQDVNADKTAPQDTV